MSLTRILHVIDDKKFISSCRETFAVQGVENLFSASGELEDKLKDGNFDILIVHFLRDTVVRALLNVNVTIPVIWFFWGGDAFSMGKFYNTFLTPKSRKARIEVAFKTSIASGCRNVLKDLIPHTVDWDSKVKSKIKVMSSFDWIVPIIPEDFDILRSAYPIKANSMHLNYISPSIEGAKSTNPTGENILLGNSASFTNNHLDAIDMLGEMDLAGRKVIIPLSYGNAKYAKVVSDYALRHLGDKAYPLKDFMPFDQYSAMMSSCNVLILNHFRQQALGNVVHAFMSGMKVCIPSKSALYDHLVGLGFIITALDGNKLSLDGLNQVQQDSNRRLCIEHFGAEKQHKRVKKLIALVTNSSPAGKV